MDETRTRTERYTGPSAARVADLLPHRVSFAKGWFWTTTTVCHGGKSDGLAFRQRPDGEGIEVRCHTRGCTSGVVITEMGSPHRASHLDGVRAGPGRRGRG